MLFKYFMGHLIVIEFLYKIARKKFYGNFFNYNIKN